MEDLLKHPVAFESAGLFCAEGEWSHPGRVIDSYELLYLQRGAMQLREGNALREVDEGEALFLRPGVYHCGTRVENPPPQFYWFHFRFPEGFTPRVLSSPHIRLPGVNNLTVLAKQLLHYANTVRYPAQCADHLINLLLIELLVGNTGGRTAGEILAQNIREWINLNYDRPITLSDVAEHFGYNPDYLTRVFKQQQNTGIKQYIAQVKMAKAKELLLSGLYPLKAIPRMVGVEDYNLFLKMFKYHEGVTPTAFRQSYWNTHLNKK